MTTPQPCFHHKLDTSRMVDRFRLIPGMIMGWKCPEPTWKETQFFRTLLRFWICPSRIRKRNKNGSQPIPSFDQKQPSDFQSYGRAWMTAHLQTMTHGRSSEGLPYYYFFFEHTSFIKISSTLQKVAWKDSSLDQRGYLCLDKDLHPDIGIW
jgi:hypothetical protein